MITASDILQARILIVDDQAANVALLEQMLRQAGYTALSSTQDPAAVCELHRLHRYDLILLDLQMPGLDGFQVMAGLKEIETGSYLPVLVITAQPDHKLRALKAGAKDFISKPFELPEVLLRVHNMLEVRLLHLKIANLNLARLENSQRLAGLGDWESDPASQSLVWSEGIYQILGLAREAFPPKAETFERLVHPDDLALYRQAKKDAAAGSHRMEFQHRIIRPDGEVRYFQQITQTSRDDRGRPVRESGTIQDITRQKLTEESFRRGEERHLHMLMLSPDAHFAAVDDCLSFVNRAFCALLGASAPVQLLGRPVLAVVHPACHPQVRAWEQLSPADPPQPPAGMRFVRLDGTTVEAEVAAVAFEFQGKKEVQVIARDVTDARRDSRA
ncbi:MAG: histidine kinase [Lacunisphaera sp.]|nr:histidine kinase [Lacunisphaera sp.]